MPHCQQTKIAHLGLPSAGDAQHCVSGYSGQDLYLGVHGHGVYKVTFDKDTDNITWSTVETATTSQETLLVTEPFSVNGTDYVAVGVVNKILIIDCST